MTMAKKAKSLRNLERDKKRFMRRENGHNHLQTRHARMATVLRRS